MRADRGVSEPDEIDVRLMAEIAAGDQHAMATLIRRHQDRVIGLAYRLLGDRHLAEDAAQDAFVQVLRSAGRYTPKARFTTWLYRIVVNRCHDLRRRHRRRKAEGLPDGLAAATDAPGRPLQAAETAARVRAAIDDLPERQRTAVLLSRFEQFSHRAIADATGWSESAVESLLVRAYARLREDLRDLWVAG